MLPVLLRRAAAICFLCSGAIFCAVRIASLSTPAREAFFASAWVKAFIDLSLVSFRVVYSDSNDSATHFV